MRDIFCPRENPARSIYQALDLESAKRSGRSVDEWILAERQAVMREAQIQARILGMHAPTTEEVETAETSAGGHADYMAKFAYGVQRIMLETK